MSLEALPGAGRESERIARLEERMTLMHALLSEIRRDQKDMANTISRASGGMRVLVLLGGLAGLAGVVRAVAAWTGTWLPQGDH